MDNEKTKTKVIQKMRTGEVKASAIAHPNIAFVKYWGKRHTGTAREKLNIALNKSVSMTLSDLRTYTTVEFGDYDRDQIIMNGEEVRDERVIDHLNLIRREADIDKKAKVFTENNFPTASGIASSASGFAALTVAACKAAGLDYGERDLSILSRQGSGSACRSIFGGYVVWKKSKISSESYAEQLADENYWELRDLIAVVSEARKKVSSIDGMSMTVQTSPLYMARLEEADKNANHAIEAIKNKDFDSLGQTIEYDSLLMHATMITTTPALLYWAPPSVAIMHAVVDMREEGIPAYHTMDAGPNVHVITLPEYTDKVEKRLKEIDGVKSILNCGPGPGAQEVYKHLF